jgi:hypothetical protein
MLIRNVSPVECLFQWRPDTVLTQCLPRNDECDTALAELTRNEAERG